MVGLELAQGPQFPVLRVESGLQPISVPLELKTVLYLYMFKTNPRR